MNLPIAILLLCAMLGLVDKILGNRMGLGEEFDRGLTMMGFSTQMMQLIQGVVFLVFVAVFADRQSLQVIK